MLNTYMKFLEHCFAPFDFLYECVVNDPVWLPCRLSDIVHPLPFVKHGEAPHHHH